MGDGYLVPAGQTDLIVSVIGEELGFVGVLVIALVYGLLVWRILRISARAPGDYTAFLALGCALSLAVPTLIIVGRPARRVSALGRGDTISQLRQVVFYRELRGAGNCVGDRDAGRAGAPGVRPAVENRRLDIAVIAAVLVGRAAWIQVRHADEVVLRPALVRQADGDVRYRYNPRLLLAARMLPRGSGPRPKRLCARDKRPRTRRAVHAPPSQPADRPPRRVPAAPSRCYPLGGLAFHALGESGRQVNWAARNTSFVERDWNHVLQGFDDRARPVEVRLADGGTSTVVKRDYRELLPLLRHKRDPSSP